MHPNGTTDPRLQPVARGAGECADTAWTANPHPPDAYVFGDEAGWKLKSVRTSWDPACAKAGLRDFHLADLRHEAPSRFDEAGMPINFVSKLLGHTNLLTTSRYLNVHRRGLHLALEKYEESRRLAISCKFRPTQRERACPEQAPPSLDVVGLLKLRWWCGSGDVRLTTEPTFAAVPLR